jgi:transposase-like protein
MVRKTSSPAQIINKLREAEILLNQGATIAEASRKIGVTEQTNYWQNLQDAQHYYPTERCFELLPWCELG